MSMYDAEGYLKRAQNAEKPVDERVKELCKSLESLIRVVKELDRKTRAGSTVSSL